MAIRCPNCKSKLTYVRLNKQELICRSCGQASEIPTVKKIMKNFAGIQ